MDTLREEQCPVCGESDAFNGDECAVCFTGDTLVRTKGGYRPISEIIAGDEVLSGDGKFHRVAEVLQRHYEGDLITLRSAGMACPVKTTPNHPFLALVGHHPQSKSGPCEPSRCNRYLDQKPRSGRGSSQYLGVSWYPKTGKWVAQGRRDGTSVNLGYFESEVEAAAVAAKHREETPTTPRHHLGWVGAAELTTSSYVAAARLFDEIDLDEIRVPSEFTGRLREDGTAVRRGPSVFPVTPDFLWAVGMYLAEGSSGDRFITFSLHADETTYQHRLIQIFEGYGYTTGASQNSGNGVDITVYSSTLSEWFPMWLGKGSQNKAIPAELLNLPLDKIQHLLSGILEGDGTNARQQFGQTSEILALQVAEIALRRGGEPTVNHHAAKGKLPVWKVLGTTYSTTQRAGGYTKRGTWRFQDRMLWRIREHSIEQYSGTVYNLRVEVDPTYVVQGTVVHNCGFVAPPSKFQDPDVDLHKQLDLRQDQAQGRDDNPLAQSLNDANRDGLDDQTGLPVNDQTADEEGALDTQPQLQCTNCGTQFEAGHPISTETTDPQDGDSAVDGPADGDVCPACGKGILEDGTELAEQGGDPQTDPDAVPDDDPDPHADEDGMSRDTDGDGVPDGDDPDPDGDGGGTDADPDPDGDGDDDRAQPGESDEDMYGKSDADSDDDDDSDDDSNHPSPARKKSFPFKR